jgi:hypothetical protein
MRLTYSYDLDTVNKQRIFNRILAENRILEADGRLYIETEPDGLYPAILQFAQTVAKISSMQYFKREVILERLSAYNPRPGVLPIAGLEFQRRLPFKSVMVHQDFESGISKKDRIRITSAADKQFPSLDDFRENGLAFFERERAA